LVAANVTSLALNGAHAALLPIAKALGHAWVGAVGWELGRRAYWRLLLMAVLSLGARCATAQATASVQVTASIQPRLVLTIDVATVDFGDVDSVGLPSQLDSTPDVYNKGTRYVAYRTVGSAAITVTVKSNVAWTGSVYAGPRATGPSYSDLDVGNLAWRPDGTGTFTAFTSTGDSSCFPAAQRTPGVHAFPFDIQMDVQDKTSTGLVSIPIVFTASQTP